MLFKLDTQQQQLKAQSGYSLLELTVVVLIIGIMAVVMIPNFSSTDPVRLDVAAEQFASAIRFVRSESIRLKQPYAFRLASGGRRIRLASINQSTTPWTLNYDVYHPITKKIYDIDLDKQTITGEADMTRVISFRGTCNVPTNIVFDSNGSAWCNDPNSVALDSFEQKFTLGSNSRLVILDGITGRVTVQ